MDTRRITGNLRGVGVMFSIRFFPQGSCQGKATTSVRFSTPVGGTVTCTADNDQACKLAESESEKIVTVFFQRNDFTDGSKSTRLFIDGNPYGGCITYTTAVTGPSDNQFEVRFFSNADCTGTQTVKGPFDVADGRTVNCIDVNNCKLK